MRSRDSAYWLNREAWRGPQTPCRQTFQFLPGYGNDESQLQRGDILVVTSGEDKHTVLYIGNHQFVSASSPETGDVYVNDKGDQTGQEIWVQPYYSWQWEVVLRYGGTN